MIQIETTPEVGAAVQGWRRSGQSIAFVPTMGNLHRGHLALVERAKREAQRVIVSIFVNPLQFGPGEDFERYPRTLAQDMAALKAAGTDGVYTPAVADIYPRDLNSMTYVEVPALSDILCGASRPGHFRGVATVVNKLFNIVQPDVAIFGEKDFQQVMVIRRMVDDLSMPLRIISAPTIREADGLAMSSRNGYLNPEQRGIAPGLYGQLLHCRDRIVAGGRDFPALETEAAAALEKRGFRPDYFSVRRANDLGLPAGADTDLVLLCAAYLGSTRLIDNLRVTLGGT